MPQKNLVICAIYISDKKEPSLNRADISFIAARYKPGTSNTTALARKSFYKLPKKDMNKWIQLSVDITAPSVLLGPNQRVAFLLYEHDPHPDKSWTYDASYAPLHYTSLDSPYGSIYMNYNDFAGNPTKEYALSGAKVKIRSYDV